VGREHDGLAEVDERDSKLGGRSAAEELDEEAELLRALGGRDEHGLVVGHVGDAGDRAPQHVGDRGEGHEHRGAVIRIHVVGGYRTWWRRSEPVFDRALVDRATATLVDAALRAPRDGAVGGDVGIGGTAVHAERTDVLRILGVRAYFGRHVAVVAPVLAEVPASDPRSVRERTHPDRVDPGQDHDREERDALTAAQLPELESTVHGLSFFVGSSSDLIGFRSGFVQS